MGFRRTKEPYGGMHSWVTWAKSNRARVLALGLPAAIMDNQRNWVVFLLHGEWPGWCLENVSTENLQQLRAFLADLVRFDDDATVACQAIELVLRRRGVM